MTKIKDVMVKNVITVTKEKSVIEAAVLMKDKGIGSLVVVQDDYPVGILTERDLVTKVLAQKIPAESTQVKDIMTKTIITADENDDFDEVNQRMEDKKIKKIPIVRNKKIVGIYTDTDLRRYIYRLNSSLND